MSILYFWPLSTQNLDLLGYFSFFEDFQPEILKITELSKFRYFAPNPENKTIPLFGPSTVYMEHHFFLI